MVTKVKVYTEVGAKRVFAAAIDWPGWCRIGRDEDAALEALIAYGPRYAEVLGPTGLAFDAPADVTALTIAERLTGDATTDFGAPSIAPTADARPVDAKALARLGSIYEVSWDALNRAAETAVGSVLRAGPRGGGRDLTGVYGHVVRAEASYVRKIGGRAPAFDEANRAAADALRVAVADAMQRAVTDGIPERGVRGGSMWSLRYFVGRAAWHVLDHAWEIEDRAEPA
jgi:hypothetical protein